jgi:hypothetical protein
MLIENARYWHILQHTVTLLRLECASVRAEQLCYVC